MKNPTSAQARFVAGMFTQALERWPNLRLSMENGGVNLGISSGGYQKLDKNRCGTVHCHGGTYALERCDLDKPINYRHGAAMMAEDLGFSTQEELMIWAKLHPEIWGNKHGYLMFNNDVAFISESRPAGSRSVCDIRAHWLEVADRLERLENGEILPKSMSKHSDFVQYINFNGFDFTFTSLLNP